MTEDDIRRVLSDMREDPVPPDSLARVRIAVDQRLSAKSRLPWFAGLIAAATLAVLIVLLRPEDISVPAAATRPAPSAVTSETQPEPVVAPYRKAAALKKPNHRPTAKRHADPVVVRIETEDPDVVILLLGD